MFEGFTDTIIAAGGADIRVLHGGGGPPVLLMHGYPQTHVMWHKLAPRLAQDFTVVATDLRGYGDSAKPPGGEGHAGYSKRAMAADQVEVMAALGFERFAVVGHDRGGRVGHRMALDHGDRVSRLAVLDIVPTYKIYAELVPEGSIVEKGDIILVFDDTQLNIELSNHKASFSSADRPPTPS